MRRRPPARAAFDDEGQMAVELAVVAPVMIVLAIVVLNVMLFVEAAARFDRVVPDVVNAVAVSGPSGQGSGEHAVAQALADAMRGLARVEVRVAAQAAWGADGEGIGFSFAPHLTRYVCTMVYVPWPASLTVAGVEAGIPFALEHERSFTVDRYRSGVLF